MATRLRSLHPLLLALVPALALALGACTKDDHATSVMDRTTALTDELVAAVRGAADKKAGVAQAQALLDDREDTLAVELEQLGQLKNIELSAEAKTAILTSHRDNLAKMEQLEHDLLAQTFADEPLDAALHALLDDHRALLTGRSR